MSAITPGDLRARNLRTLAMLAALFVLPLALAFFTYYGTGWRPQAHINHGELIVPARPLPSIALPRIVDPETGSAAPRPAPQAVPFRGHWSLVYVGSGDCPSECRQALYVMRQTRVALNNDMARVERIFLVTTACCELRYVVAEHAGLQVLDATTAGAELLVQFPGAGREHTLFVVDPLGNLLMSYDARANPSGLLQDLKKLLALSHIG